MVIFNFTYLSARVGVGRAASIRQDMAANQTRLSVGCFTIYPGFGTILPGGTQHVTVDCVAENVEKTEEVSDKPQLCRICFPRAA